MIYLDYQATTPLAPEAFDAMLPWLRDQHANPHSAHRPGRAAKATVEVAREQVGWPFGADGALAFTGGATEALNWAIQGTTGPIVTIATEHPAVLRTVEAEARRGRALTILPVDADGIVDLDAARAAIRPGQGGLVAAMLVNNEIGVIQPFDTLAGLARDAEADLLCDAVQGYGRVPMPSGCTMVALSAHKVHGPKGVGALWAADGHAPLPLLHGGAQEPGRAGTLSPALCAGFGAAARLAQARFDADAAHVARLWDVALSALGDGWTVNGSVARRYRGNLNVRFPGLDVARLMSDLGDIAFSAGAACASGSGRPSHVLAALGLDRDAIRASIRLGFGRYTAETELADACARIGVAARAR